MGELFVFCTHFRRTLNINNLIRSKPLDRTGSINLQLHTHINACMRVVSQRELICIIKYSAHRRIEFEGPAATADYRGSIIIQVVRLTDGLLIFQAPPIFREVMRLSGVLMHMHYNLIYSLSASNEIMPNADALCSGPMQ